jgi:hypothetical protein
MQVIIARELQAIARPRKRALGNDLCGSGKGDGQIQSHARQFDFLRALFTGSHPHHRVGCREGWLRGARLARQEPGEILRGVRRVWRATLRRRGGRVIYLG